MRTDKIDQVLRQAQNAKMRSDNLITFKPIDLELHRNLVIEFREDSFVVSFGDATRFHEADKMGADRYLAWLKAKLEKNPQSVVHAWRDGKIIGQIELGHLKADPERGHVFLYYLAPEFRGQGLGKTLDQYAMNFFRNGGQREVRLSVSPTNLPAWKFYLKLGWKDIGPRPGHPEVHFFQKIA
jgi:ribosomal protein S18 acetylase RimI-like enzyme